MSRFKLLFSCILLFVLSACSTQPDWLVRKRLYPDWEVTSRRVNNYDFDWKIMGDSQAQPTQIFSTDDEIWIQWPTHYPQPVILAQTVSGQQVLKVYQNPPYLVLKKKWRHLIFKTSRAQAEAYQSF